ncbi:MAG TPA: phosphate ABC transporter substrate-binding/OmpA family protein [Spirochaetota bacterium]|nr:phosphate ABC transporter substrate-binding/OmpA family protein [Spirochaetota bacterium]HPJ41266.1 phosphate ABC transporter substrate-binding/OmpA family protein [Spirochaetota bacterium]HPR36583.1 phosphate ABC transporter substrate-binding/OmpA family protein [Spirochaetota bacterium]
MQELKRLAGLAILAAVIGGGIFVFFEKKEAVKEITFSTSDAKGLKGEISIALDSWIGYFYFKSPVFGTMMRDEGYRIKVIDDKADYPERMKMLKDGEIDFAVCTVDSYLLNGKSVKYPGAIIAVLDQSKGGDAVVAWKDSVQNIEALKTKQKFTIAFTPASPSEHLLKAISSHFDIPLFASGDTKWRVEVNGAEEGYEKFMKRGVDCAAIWEPHVTEALSDPGVVKLIGSEDIENLIVDILLVNRNFAKQKPELVNLLLRKYFETMNYYRSSPLRLKQDITAHLSIAEKKVEYMLKGVKWINYAENTTWFGLTTKSQHKQPEIVDAINSTLKILIENKDFSSNPLIDNDPYTVINSAFIASLYGGVTKPGDDSSASDQSLNRRFAQISDREWLSLSVVGSLKIRPVTFRSGTSMIDESGQEQIKEIVESIRHYPNFRILVKGHSGLKGDPSANSELSRVRAEAVKKIFVTSYGMDPNRIRTNGVGSGEPLSRLTDESEREYDNRLKRVEVMLLTEK